MLASVADDTSPSWDESEKKMDVSFSWDLPPVPDCFSKLLVAESETSALPNQPWREAERLRELKDIMLKSLAQDSVPDTAHVVNGERTVSGTIVLENGPVICDSTQAEGVRCVREEKENPEKPLEAVALRHSGDSASPLCRLNSALGRLKQEMVDLRHMDMSLFCQLLSLNEAIHDFKSSVSDRYSEYTGSEYTCSEYAGSEYSMGGMGSRAGSLSSLIEEGELGGDYNDDPNSPLSQGGVDRQSSGSDMASSTSSLLQQIKALTQRAEADFGL
ncbi:hypothetical protein V1264_019579 [Littorina saxatilis]